MGTQGLENTGHVRLAPQEVLGLGLQAVAHRALGGQDDLVGGARGRPGTAPSSAQPTAVLLVDLQGRSREAHQDRRGA